MTDAALLTLDELQTISSVDDRKKYNLIETFFPQYGPLRRELYVKHLEFFRAGIKYQVRIFIAGNQLGKTTTGGLYEVVQHATGKYQRGWEGARYPGPNDWWICGETINDVRDVIQKRMLGPVGDFGTGMIPKDCLVFESLKEATKDDTFIRTFRVKHFNDKGEQDGYSTFTLKSYDQGRKVFQGLPANILLDEEPPEDILNECFARLTTNRDDRPLKMMLTFTPLKGMSKTLQSLFPDNKIVFGDLGNGTYAVNASVYDAPHVTEAEIQKMLKRYPKHQHQARLMGLPTITEGAVYGIPEDRFVIEPCHIPDFWPRVGGLDVGWNRTSAVWLAHDRDNGIWHLYREYYVAQLLPSEHAEGLRALGEWIPLNIDPASRGRSQRDGEQLMENYKDLGLNIVKATNAVSAGIDQVLTLLAEDKLKVWNTCRNWLEEYRRYSRDEDGKIIKKDDHLMDATRYAICTHAENKTGRDQALTEAEWKARRTPIAAPDFGYDLPSTADSWMLS